jgi:uncharacterized protein involved in high-affinity Fe2+ transport
MFYRPINQRTRGVARLAALALLAAVAILAAGCAAADKPASPAASGSPASSSASGRSGGSRGSGSMAGMHMGGGGMSVDGIKPVPTQMLGEAKWQGMKITAMAMTAVPFVIFNGTKEKLVKLPKNASFHLMVRLSDAYTGVPIPYASVWATITKDGKIVSDERQWPMISRYIGPHYGNDVSLPGAGAYQLALLVSPPVSARHVEYEHVWLKPHHVKFTFHWKPVS